MRGTRQSRLVGAIRLAPENDCIGIPLFQRTGSNALFIPETDDEFSISRFIEFHNEAGYVVSYQLPHDLREPHFSVGDPAPIPFWIGNCAHLVEGDATKSALIKQFGKPAMANPVLADLGRLLQDARTGQFRNRRIFREAEEVRVRFHDVFYEPPVRSQYWVSRYRRAVGHARKVASPPHPIDRDLRRRGREWLEKFGAKCDLRRLRGVLGTPEDGIFSSEQIQDAIYAHCLNAFVNGNPLDLGDETQRSEMLRMFPTGIYGHYLSRGTPRLIVNYAKPRDLQEVLKSEIYKGLRTREFRRSLQLATLFFGESNAPTWADDVVVPILMQEKKKLDSLIAEGRGEFRSRASAHRWKDLATEILNQYELMVQLEGILNGSVRSHHEDGVRQFGMTTEFLQQVRQLANRTVAPRIRHAI